MPRQPDRPAPLGESLERLRERFAEGRPAALAQAISVVEDQREGFEDLLHAALREGPRARRVGLTGPPGAGKSTLVACLTGMYRARGERVGIVAVDPSSPQTGGALLGDRVRMGEVATDAGVFIRSMASRGSRGGLATTTLEVVDLVDAFGFERVLIETVGVGQTELDVTSAADTVVVVLVPESGDTIQAMKAGLMEIADVFVVNKADRPGAERLANSVRESLQLRESKRDWVVPVLTSNALSGKGVAELVETVDRHRDWLETTAGLERLRRGRAGRRVRDVVERELRRVVWTSAEVRERLDARMAAIESGEETPYSVAREILGALLR